MKDDEANKRTFMQDVREVLREAFGAPPRSKPNKKKAVSLFYFRFNPARSRRLRREAKQIVSSRIG